MLTGRRCAASLALLLALLVGGCGGPDHAGSSSAKARFATRAEGVCAKAEQRGKELHAPTGRVATISFLEAAHALLAQTESELHGVSPPAASRAAYGRFLAAVAEEARSVGELANAVRDGNAARYHATTKRMSANTANAQAQALGLPGCAETVEPKHG